MYMSEMKHLKEMLFFCTNKIQISYYFIILQVNKRSLESQILQNGTNTKLQNGGSYNSSLDSGISAFSGIVPLCSSFLPTSNAGLLPFRLDHRKGK